EFGKNWDDVLFRERIMARLTPDAEVLDVGAGAGIVEQMRFKGHVKRICGVDLDPRVEENPHLDEGRLADAGSIPYGDDMFDLVFADNVMEHLDDPVAVFNEIRRVLKPGGHLLFKTPNRNHYMPLIARLTPHSFHQFYNKLRGREAEDTFLTHYLANSKSQVAQLAETCGLKLVDVERIEGRPEYLRITFPTYLAGAAYERVVNATSAFAGIRILLVATLQKPMNT
ncbi:MAG: class I SAM-dependent methyltransferase, partial [Pseudomonadota bacterium]